MDRRLRRAPDAEWVLMYRLGLSRQRIAALVRVPAAAVGYHLAIARRQDPGLEAEHQAAAAPSPYPSPTVGKINGRTFVNNASFGVYAEVVQSREYREDKSGTVLQMLPDLIVGDKGARLCAQVDGATVDGPQVVLVSNGPYYSNDLAGLGRRTRLDRGVLGAVALSAASTREAVRLLRRASKSGLIQRAAAEVDVGADVPEIPVGVDGEALLMSTPVRCTIEPRALRVLVPRNRPGIPPAQPSLDLVRLRELAWGPRAASKA